MASVVLSLFNSSSIELSDEKESVKFLDCTICSNSSYQKQDNENRSASLAVSHSIINKL